MRIVLFALFATALLSGFPAKANSPRVHNLAPQFVQFWKNAKDKPLAEQIKEFDQTIYPTFPEFYDYKFRRWAQIGKTKEEGLQKAFTDYIGISQKFEEKTASITSEISLNLAPFLRQFPDFNTDFDISIIHSLGEMDGGTRIIDGKFHFILGVDGIAKYHSGSTDTPFLHHELFHVYHWQFFKGEDKLWMSLWSEGLATYVSEALNPGSSTVDIMLDIPTGLVGACESDLVFLWNDIKTALDSTDEAVYTTYFLLSSQDPRVPKRAGYYLGYRIAKMLAKTHSLDELVKMKPDKIRQLIEDTVVLLSKEAASQP